MENKIAYVFPEEGQIREVYAQRDHYKALCEELRGALLSITSGLADHLKAGTVRCDSCKDEVENARAALAKIKDLP